MNEQSRTSATPEMTQSAKYVFLDVVGYTDNRNVEAQSDIVTALNMIVLESMADFQIVDESRLFIPTGDGLCIALLNTEGEYSYDIHMLLALKILEFVQFHNSNEPDEMRNFQVRIGINANEDNLITDINARKNLAGSGISLASRIMDKADGGQILVGDSVFERLQQRERYMGQFREFGVTDKHGRWFRLHQYVGDSAGLNTDVPKAFHQPTPKEVKAQKLSLQMAYYLAHAIKNRAFISQTYKSNMIAGNVLQVLLYILSEDESELHKARHSDSKVPIVRAWKSGEATFEEQFKHYDSCDSDLISILHDLTGETLSSKRYDQNLFQTTGMWLLFASDAGKTKLQNDYPEIWNSWGLS